MTPGDRLYEALFGATAGGAVGVAGWWLYGLAHSLNYNGAEMDPILKHWIICSGVSFAILGFLFPQRLGALLGDTISAILHFEAGTTPRSGSNFFSLIFLAIIVAAIWFTVPSLGGK